MARNSGCFMCLVYWENERHKQTHLKSEFHFPNRTSIYQTLTIADHFIENMPTNNQLLYIMQLIITDKMQI